MKDIEKEILVIKNILKLLNDCLSIHMRNCELSLVKKTYVDIVKVKAELKKLIAARDKELEAEKEPAGDGATLKRSGESIL